VRLSVRDSSDNDEHLIMDENASIDAPLGFVLPFQLLAGRSGPVGMSMTALTTVSP
jgi:hypothetical protein